MSVKARTMAETERLILRDMSEADTEAFLEIFSDPVAMKYFGVIFDRPRMLKWVQDNLEHQRKHSFSLMTVVLKETNEVIGDCGLETTEINGRLRVGIGFDFKRKCWNQGYATEAANAVMEHAFSDLELDNLSAWINPENGASRRVAEKLGMTIEKTIPRGGKPYAVYSISRSEWENRPTG